VIRFWIISVMLALAGLSTLNCVSRCDDPRHSFAGKTLRCSLALGLQAATPEGGRAEVIAGETCETSRKPRRPVHYRRSAQFVLENFAALVLTPAHR